MPSTNRTAVDYTKCIALPQLLYRTVISTTAYMIARQSFNKVAFDDE